MSGHGDPDNPNETIPDSLPERQHKRAYTFREIHDIIYAYISGHLSTDNEVAEIIGHTWYEGHAEALNTHGIPHHDPRQDLVVLWMKEVFGTVSPQDPPPTDMTV